MTYQGSDFYCDVAIPRAIELDIVHECADVLAFHHTRPYWPAHLVVVPKRHIDSLSTVTSDDEPIMRSVLKVVQRVAENVERQWGAARVITNLGRYQDSKHLHIHVVSGDQHA